MSETVVFEAQSEYLMQIRQIVSRRMITECNERSDMTDKQMEKFHGPIFNREQLRRSDKIAMCALVASIVAVLAVKALVLIT